MELAIVIVNWNSGALLRRCLASIPAEEGPARVASVIVVDNGSSDDSLADLSCPAPLRIERRGRNEGFARGCNVGAALVPDVDALLFLNPDAALRPGALGAAASALAVEAPAPVGIVGVRLIGESGATHRSCARRPTTWTFLRQALGVDALGIPGWSLHLTEFGHETDADVEHVMGAFYLVRRTLFDALGGFDERFFVYLEDLDFSVRAQARGFVVRFLGTPTVLHKGGGTSENARGPRLAYCLESRLRYARKHLGALSAAGIAAVTFTVEPMLRVVHAAAGRSGTRVRDVAEGYRLLVERLGAGPV